jgi:hypothetical protein
MPLSLPEPILGNVCSITISSPDLEVSLTYWQRLGFKELSRFDFPFPWIQITDGALLIFLRLDTEPYIGLGYYTHDPDTLASTLEATGIIFAAKPQPEDAIKRYLIKTPEGFNIALVENVRDFFVQPPGPTMLKMPQEDFFKPEKYVNKTIGLFGELARPVGYLEASMQYWEKLGFKALSKFSTPYPWAILSDGLAVIGLHQIQSFSYSAITYFAADMPHKIEALKEAGLDNYEEKSGGIVLKTPEGQYINLFKLGM